MSTGSTQQSNATIRVIGDRGSGKTTYMASLAYWPNANPEGIVKSIIPINPESSELIQKAKDILEQGLTLEPTPLTADVSDVKDYSLIIKVKDSPRFGNFKFGRNSNDDDDLSLTVSCKDYPGEFFSDLLQRGSYNSQLSDYLDDCIEAQGILLLIDGMANRKDATYAGEVEAFLRLLDRSEISLNKRRIALAICKCEQSELWVNVHRPEYVASKRFPKTYRVLQNWGNTNAGSFECFTTSAFGMVGNNYPMPNSTTMQRGRDGVTSVIKDPARWRPYGLVSPVYWLCTGKRHKDLP